VFEFRASRFAGALGGDNLEHVTVRVSEEDPLEWCRALRSDQLGAQRREPGTQRLDLGQRISDGNVPTKFALERRSLEIFNLDQVQFLPWCNLQPCRGPVDVERR